MPSIEVPSLPLNESLDYGQPLELATSSASTPAAPLPTRSSQSNGTCARTSGTWSEASLPPGGCLTSSSPTRSPTATSR